MRHTASSAGSARPRRHLSRLIGRGHGRHVLPRPAGRSRLAPGLGLVAAAALVLPAIVPLSALTGAAPTLSPTAEALTSDPRLEPTPEAQPAAADDQAGSAAAVPATAFGASPSAAAAPPPPSSAADETLEFAAVDDAYASERWPDRVFDSHRLTAGNQPGNLKVAYLKFHVAGVPDGATGVQAVLSLKRDHHHLPDHVEAWGVDDTSWSEGGLTMNNAPQFGESLGSVAPTRSTSSVSFPVTSVQGNGTFSLAVTSSAKDDVARFRSSEATAGVAPSLKVSYRSPTGAERPAPRPPGEPDASADSDKLWIGAAVSERAANGRTDNSIGEFNEANPQIGPLTFRRSFDTSLPASFDRSAAAQDAASGYRSFVSWKPPNGDFVGAAQGRYDAQVTAWAESVPTSGVYATSFHEPENDMTGPQFVAMQRHLYEVVKAANPTIQWGPVYMAYWWDPAAKDHYIGNPDEWWVGSDHADFSGVDVYAFKPTPLEGHSEFRGWYDYMRTKNVPLLIAEYGQYAVRPGAKVDPALEAERAVVIRQDAAWIRDQGTFDMWLYWDALGRQGDWRLRDEASQAAWREVSEPRRTS